MDTVWVVWSIADKKVISVHETPEGASDRISEVAVSAERTDYNYDEYPVED